MRDFITVDREANAIRLRRSAFTGTFLLVEGRSDKIFYQRFVDKDKCELVTTSGKPSSKFKAIEILQILDNDNFRGVLAIVDADYDRLDEISYNTLNLLCTDTHDLETTIIKSFALNKVIAEFGSEEKIDKFQHKKDIRQALLDSGLTIGYLRWVSQTEKLNLTFSTIEFTKFIDEKTLEIDEIKFFQEVKNKSQIQNLKNDDIQQLIINKQNKQHDSWQICCGHDLVHILSIALRKSIGTNNKKEVEPDILERSLRLAYEEAYFIETELYQNICIWERNNQPFRVLDRKAQFEEIAIS